MPARLSNRILRSKLLPPASRAWELDRPQLIARLREGHAAPFSIICGMAGSGKSTLARQWAAELVPPAAWITLDATDNDFNRFVRYLIAAIAGTGTTAGAATLADLSTGDSFTVADIANTLSDEILSGDRKVTIVLDDFHTIVSEPIIAFLDELFRFPPPQLHICFVGRADPPVRLASYRARFPIAEIRLAQLLLSLEETNAFLRATTGGTLSRAAVDRLYDQSEGWIAGLHLTALALRNLDGSSAAWEGDLRVDFASMDYLVSEIVDRVPAELRDHLPLLAIPERINAELAWRLLQSPESSPRLDLMLQEIEANGYFLSSLGDDRVWYRFHPLVRDALLHSGKERLGEAEVARGHQVAADWFGEHHHIDEAIQHLLAAGRPDLAADLVEQQAQIALAGDQWLELGSWLDMLPRSVRSARIELLLARAWIEQIRGSYGKIPALIEDARALVNAQAAALGHERTEMFEAEIELLDAIVSPHKPDVEVEFEIGLRIWRVMCEHDRAGSYYALYFMVFSRLTRGELGEALAFLEQLILQQSPRLELFSMARVNWIRTYYALLSLWAGDLQTAQMVARTILNAASERTFPRLASHARYILGAVAFERNEMETALAHDTQAADEPRTGIAFRTQADHERAIVATLLGRHDLTNNIIQRLEDLALATDSFQWLEAIRALRAQTDLTRGLSAPLPEWADSMSDGAPPQDYLGLVVIPQIRARTLIEDDRTTSDQLVAAGQMLAELLEKARVFRAHRLWLAARVLQAALLDRLGQEAEAIAHLQETIDGAKGHIGSFLLQGRSFERVFAKLVRSQPLSQHARVLQAALTERSRVSNALAETPAPSNHPKFVEPTGAVEHLSEREREVLLCLADRRSNKEIAEALGISPQTVKRHTINIYAKLGVGSRRQAVRVAFAGDPTSGR